MEALLILTHTTRLTTPSGLFWDLYPTENVSFFYPLFMVRALRGVSEK